MAKVSEQHLYVPAREVHNYHKESRTVALDKNIPWKDIEAMGFGFDHAEDLLNLVKAHQGKKLSMDSLGRAFAMDADVYPTITDPSIGAPVQFLQNWLPGYIYMLTTPRLIDELVGVSTVGQWRDEEIVRVFAERTGNARPYSDYGQVPFSNWNTNYLRRSIVRFEEGMRVGRLESERASAINLSISKMLRESCMISLEVIRNYVGFYGYNNGTNNTYGFLNDPNLPAYIAVANGASASPLWSRKTFLEIQADLLTLFQALATQSQGYIDLQRTPLTLAIPTAVNQYLNVTSDFGMKSVRQWLLENYPNLRIVSVPQLAGANGGANVFYIYADSISDESTDGGATFYQAVPTKMMTVGVEQQAKAYVEDYANATAGVMLQRPLFVVRGSGI